MRKEYSYFIFLIAYYLKETYTLTTYCDCQGVTPAYCYYQVSNCNKYNTPDQNCEACVGVEACATPVSYDCKECSASYINGQCWKKLDNCTTQTQNTCTQCNDTYQLQPFNSTVQICINKTISDCLYYFKDNECQNCTTNFHLSSKKEKCYSNIPNCSQYNDQECTACNSGYKLYTNNSYCFPTILNCLDSQFSNESQSTYCLNCNTEYSLTQNSLCHKTDPNCGLFSSDFSSCVKCKTNYTYYMGKCSECPIQYCNVCATSSIFGQICGSCATNYVKGPNALTCVAACQSTNSLANCITCANKACTMCADGYYLNSQSQCIQCGSKYANCDQCSLNKCTSCSSGYYYDNSKSYCYQCSQLNPGCSTCLNTLSTGLLNNVVCQYCQSGYILSRSFICIKCSSLFENCETCKNNGGDQYECLTCSQGALQMVEATAKYCLDCSGSIVNIPNCYSCDLTINTAPYQYSCKQCKNGYYYDNQTCLACPISCSSCNSATVCTACQSKLILYGNQCTNDTTGFSLTTTATSSDALAYTTILVTEQSLGTYPTIGTLNSKGYFCSSDKQCNMNGRCLLISCKCIKNIAGSRCQFTTSTDFLKLQSDMLSYLTAQTTYNTNYIDSLLLLSDTTFSVSESTILSFQTVLSKFINLQFDIKYFTIIGAISKNIFNQETIATQKLKNLDNLLLNATIKQAETMMISEVQTTSGPFHKQTIGKFDLNSDDSFAVFKQNFIQQYPACDNVKQFLTPQIYLSQDNAQQIKALQSNASTPLIFNQMHLYYQTTRSSGQTINSTVSRIQFIKSGSILSITDITAVIVVPKADQQYADLNENNICVQWNDDKQIWENAKATLLKCKYYTVCQVAHFSDFGTYVQVIKNTTRNVSSLSDILYINTEFEFRKAVQNGAFAISMTLVGLFIVFSILLTILFKRAADKPKRQKNKPSSYESGFVDTERQVMASINKVKIKKPKNFWSVYPVNAIFTASSLEFSLQKLSLYILQLQMYVTFTSVYLSSLPFKFGMLTAYYLLVIIQTWICNYLYGGFALAFRKKSKGKVLGFYWVLYFVIFFGNMIIGIWQMYGVEFKFDMYLLVGVIIEYVMDGIFCDLFITYLYQSLFINEVVGIFKIIKFKGYYES